ncbi:MAG: cell wall-active antibiotics response protein LiaF [Bacteroidota bacterium]
MRNLFWGFILVLFGVLLLLDNLGIADFGEMLRQFWPVLIILWGVSILLRRKKNHSYQQPPMQTQQPPPQPQSQPEGQMPPPPPPPPADYSFVTDGDIIHQSEVFGDTHITVTSQNFMGGSVSTVFGNCNVDLSKAKWGAGEHTLRIHTVFGDSRLILPPDTAYSISANSTFGDMIVKDQRKGGFSSYIFSSTPGYETAEHKLKLSISKVFGDLIIS